MFTISFNRAESLVKEQQALGNDVVIDGYSLVFYRPADHAMHSVNGSWRKGQWAFKNVVPLTAEGTYSIDSRNLIRKPRQVRVAGTSTL